MNNHKDQVRFGDLIKVKSGYEVLPLTADIIAELTPLITQAILNYNAGPVWTGRVNEFGNHMETVLAATAPTLFDTPRTAKGLKRSTGYPDHKYLSATTKAVYVECKIFDQGSIASAQRSFYISSFDKITADAVHAVVSFEHVNKILTGNFKLVDMRDVVLTLKHEYQCGNDTLYPK